MGSWTHELRQIVVDVCFSRYHLARHHFLLWIDDEAGDSARPYFIKYDQLHILGEARTLDYLHGIAQSDPQAPRIPKVYDYFPHRDKRGIEYQFLVMEYISPPVVTLGRWIHSGQTDQECQQRADAAAEKVSEAISWLRDCPLPSNSTVGPVGGGVMYHRFFQDSKAPMPFANVAALEIYINKVLSYDRKRRGSSPHPQTIELRELPVQFCHSDITYENFLIHPETLEIWLIDGRDISVLPAPFATYALTFQPDCLLSAVASRIGLFSWPKMEIFCRAAHLVKWSNNDTFGLDSFGREAPPAGPQTFIYESVPPYTPQDHKHSHIRVVEIPAGEEEWRFYPLSDPYKFITLPKAA